MKAAFALCVVVDVADRDVLDRLRVADLPHLADVLERGDEGLARGGVVHRRHPRALLAVAVHRRDGLDQVQLAVEHAPALLRQVVGHGDVLAVGRMTAALRVLMPARTSATTFRFQMSNLEIQPSREAKKT
jgi:hypothetical protein